MVNTDNPTPTPEPTANSTSVHRKRRGLIIVGSIVIVLLILAGIFVWHPFRAGQKVYAEVDGHKIYKSDVVALIHGRPGITIHESATVLADKYLSEAMAKEHNVSVSQQDIMAAGSTIVRQKGQNPYAYQNLVNQVYFNKLAANNQGSYKGKLLIANFSRYVPFKSSILPLQKKSNPKLGNPTAIAADKKYAQNFITSLYNRIKAHKITFNQAITAEHNDPVVGKKAYVTQPHSQVFEGPLSNISPLAANSVRSKMAGMKPGTLTAPFVVRTPDSAYDNKSTAESYFLVVQLNTKSGGGTNLTFPQELVQAKKQLGYKVNV